MDQSKIHKILPLTPLQKGMLFHQLFDSRENPYIEQLFLGMDKHFDVQVFQRSLQWLVDRHEALRTVFIYNKLKEPRQVILKSRKSAFTYVDLSEKDEVEKQQLMSLHCREDRKKGFDIGADPLLRVILFKTGENRCHVLWTHHHIILDGWCRSILIREFLAAYESFASGAEPRLSPAKGYSHFVEWLQRQPHQDTLQFWRSHLDGLQEFTALPFLKNAVALTGEQDRYVFSFDPGTVRAIDVLCKKHGVTLNAFCITLWAVLLRYYTGSEDMVVGTIVSGRPAQMEQVESMIGLFINTLPLRIRIDARHTFWHTALQVQEDIASINEHTSVGLDEIKSMLPQRSVLFDHIFNFENYLMGERNAPPDTGPTYLSEIRHFEQTNYPFNIGWQARGGNLEGIFLFDKSLDRQTISALELHLRQIAECCLDQPDLAVGDIEVLTKEERALLHSWGRGPAQATPEFTLAQAFAGPHANPEQVALISGDDSFTYAELEKLSGRVAHHLSRHGIKRADRVAVDLPIGEWQVITMIGILKAGAAYVPVSPRWPADRKKHVLEQASVKALITTETQDNISCDRILLQELVDKPQDLADEIFPHLPAPDDEAYVIFTSGTTGKPKGIVHTHRSLCDRVRYFIDYLRVVPGRKALQFAAMSFDASLFECFTTWFGGATLVMVPEDVRNDLQAFITYVTVMEVDIAMLPPTYLAALDKHPLPTVSQIFTTGEAAIIDSALYYAQTKEFINCYGPTETCIGATFHTAERGRDYQAERSVPIGKPFANTHLYVLTPRQQLCPAGIAGELFISGPTMTPGYVGMPELTEKVFLLNPFSQEPGYERVYKTGDLVRWNTRGELEFLGSVDEQVQLNGIRVELGEIEQVILELLPVSHAAVLLDRKAAVQRLAAFVVPREGSFDPASSREKLAHRLPGYMVPAVWLDLDELPTGVNGKIDKKRLLELLQDYSVERVPAAQPATMLQRELAVIWSTVLGRANVGVNDNFFELGGDSIKALQLVSMFGQKGWELELKYLFLHPTIEGIEPWIKAKAAAVQAADARGGTEVPLSPVQAWFFRNITAHPYHWNYAEPIHTGRRLDIQCLEKALAAVLQHHDQLRAVFRQHEGRWVQNILPFSENLPAIHDIPGPAEAGDLLQRMQGSFDLGRGPLVGMARVHMAEEDVVVLAIHHLVVDFVSWKTIKADLISAYISAEKNEKIGLPAKTASFDVWVQALKQIRPDVKYWKNAILVEGDVYGLKDGMEGTALSKNKREVSFTWSAEKTNELLHTASLAYTKGGVQAALLFAVGKAFCTWSGSGKTVVVVESHGRSLGIPVPEVSRTVGWFTAFFPFVAEADDYEAHAARLLALREKAVDYMLLDWTKTGPSEFNISFNYFGQVGQEGAGNNEETAELNIGHLRHPESARPFGWEVSAAVNRGRLHVSFRYDGLGTSEEEAGLVCGLCAQELSSLLEQQKRAVPQDAHVPVSRNRTGHLIPMNEETTGTPLVLFPNTVGKMVVYTQLIRALEYPGPIVGFELKDFSEWQSGTLDQVVNDAFELLLEYGFTEKPLFLGHSLGGILTFEIAKKWEQHGHGLQGAIILDQPPFLKGHHTFDLEVDLQGQLNALFKRLSFLQGPELEQFRQSYTRNHHLVLNYVTEGHVHAPLAGVEVSLQRTKGMDGWSKHFEELVSLEQIEGDHFEMLRQPFVSKVAALVGKEIKVLQGRHIEKLSKYAKGLYEE